MYSYTLFKQKGSGEYALTYLLAPGAFARDPLMNRFAQVDRNLEIVFMYGDNDWMDSKAGKQASTALKQDGRKSRHKIVSNAGHHLYLDNFDEFNEYMEGVLKDTERESEKRA